MSVEEAGRQYVIAARWVLRFGLCSIYTMDGDCPWCAIDNQLVDAASIAYDLAVAEASHERIRAQVAI